MKRSTLLLAVITAAAILCSCDVPAPTWIGEAINRAILEIPETAQIGEVVYKRAFESGYIYPKEEEPYSYTPTNGVKVKNHKFYPFTNTEYDCRICYDYENSAAPAVYFSEQDYSAAVAYYGNADNYTEYFVTSTGFPEERTYEVELDREMAEALRIFTNENELDPFSDEGNERTYRVELTDEEFRKGSLAIYRVSKDLSFQMSITRNLRIIDGRVVFVYCYYGGGENEIAECVDLPDELSDYVLSLLDASMNTEESSVSLPRE